MGEHFNFGTLADKALVEEMSFDERRPYDTVYQALATTAGRVPDRPAISFQIKSGPKDPAETLSWGDLHRKVTQAANLFRRLGVGPDDTVAYMLPNCNEAAIALAGGATAGIVNPINPLLEPEQIGHILAETGAKVLVTLASMPKTDVAQKAHRAAALAPSVKTILEVDLKRYLTPPLSWLVPLLRPKLSPVPSAKVMNFNDAIAGEDSSKLSFEEEGGIEKISAYFHTGGTTGMPKIAQHKQRGMLYNGVGPCLSLIDENSVLLCPLPMFHVMAAYPMFMSCLCSGAHLIMPTPQGYRGDGVMDNFWKLCERWKVTFMVTVPTAASALMQRPVDADMSTVQYAFCGSAPLPVELFKQFEKATGVMILEGYGMTEATCVVSVNPPHGEKKIGSVGLPFPYTDVKILHCDENGGITKECGTDEIGEICVLNPGVMPGYREADRNAGLFAGNERYLRTGDLGRIDADGYLWITGRAKDLIIRGGHNIDPAVIEEALAGHPDVAFVGAIGQPDAHAGEIPCAYVELIDGASTSNDALTEYAAEHISERAAIPKHVEVLDELPKTAVGKVFKPDLRKRAIERVYGAALREAGIESEIEVQEDKTRGLVATVVPKTPGADEAAIGKVLGTFPRPWQMGLNDG
ncbi:MAG: acyl-CoA synthetase [Pseudomonadota bacterium]